jgi:hypothetical protein
LAKSAPRSSLALESGSFFIKWRFAS